MRTLRQAIVRRWAWLWDQNAKMWGRPSAIGKNKQIVQQLDRLERRHRFWADFREGQRQAEEKCLEAEPLTRGEA
jgi:hypothetical protein